MINEKLVERLMGEVASKQLLKESKQNDVTTKTLQDMRFFRSVPLAASRVGRLDDISLAMPVFLLSEF